MISLSQNWYHTIILTTLAIGLLLGTFALAVPAASAFTFSGGPSWNGGAPLGNYCAIYRRPIGMVSIPYVFCEDNGLNSFPPSLIVSGGTYTYSGPVWRENQLAGTTFPPASGFQASAYMFSSFTNVYLGQVPRSRYKESSCSTGRVATGARFYGVASGLDDEYVESSCTAVSGTSLSGKSWYSAPSPTAGISGYKTALCPAGAVATGLRMFGIPSSVDDEHVEIECAVPTNAVFGASRWVPQVVAGSFQNSVCGAGEAMTGVRWYQVPVSVDDEHVDAYCTRITPNAASVQLNFM